MDLRYDNSVTLCLGHESTMEKKQKKMPTVLDLKYIKIGTLSTSQLKAGLRTWGRGYILLPQNNFIIFRYAIYTHFIKQSFVM